MKWLRVLAILLAVAALLMFALSGPGTRLGMWHYRVGLTMLRYAAYTAIGASVVALLAILITKPRGTILGALVVAMVAGLVTFGVPYRLQQQARRLPPIHDITTDTEDPPVFVDVLPLRADATNKAEYGGDSIAALQKADYQDIKTISMSLPAETSYTRALDVARDMGWEIVAADAGTGRIEATATTSFFGFKDDVVIRVKSADSGNDSRVDIRSVSRVGRSDVGANAARIRAFTERMKG